MKVHWIDRLTESVAPRWTLKRQRARLASELIARNYEAASVGRRTQGWRRVMTDANAANGPSLSMMRDLARDLVRNNPYASSALATIVDQVVGYGIRATIDHERWQQWSETPACDVAGRQNLAGLTRIVMRGVVESGEMLVRRHFREASAELPLPIQLQVLEPDFLDTMRDQALPNGGRIIQGIEFDAQQRRVAYWLFGEHPGGRFTSSTARFSQSQRIPADEIVHVFRQDRAGQVRAVSWFAPVLLTFKDFDELSDATLVKQKIAACLAIATIDTEGIGEPLGDADPDNAALDKIYPGMIKNLPIGRDIKVIEPPTVREYPDFARITLQGIATGIGLSPEGLTGDYTDLPFSAARMSRLRQHDRVHDWRWNMLIPQFLDPVWSWAMQASAIMGETVVERTDWTPPPLPMIEPDAEGLAIQRNIRTGISTLSESLRERGYDPRKALEEMARDWELLDELGLVLDSDPRKMTQAGQLQSAGAPADDSRGLRDLRELMDELRRALEAKRSPRRKAAAPINGNGSHAPTS